MKTSLINLAAACLLIIAASFSFYLARHLEFYTAYPFATILLLLGGGTVLQAPFLENKIAARNPRRLCIVIGLLLLASFFYFFVRGWMRWGAFNTPTFQNRLLVFAVVGCVLTALLQLFYQLRSASDYLRQLHANTFYFGLVFLMSVVMMKYRDPSRVDAIGTVSTSLFCLIQAVGLLKGAQAAT